MAWAGRGVMGGGGGGVAFSRQSTPRSALRFRIQLDGSEPTVVSYKKLLNEVDAAETIGKSGPPVGANPALEARLAPGGAITGETSNKLEDKVGGDPVKDPLPAPPNRFSHVIEKIEALYKGGASDDDEDTTGQQNRVYGGDDTDQYDTQDSFIDDADLDAYFQTDKARLKHKGFFVNKGKLEKLNDSSSLPSAPSQKMLDRKRPMSKGKEEKRAPKVIAKERVVKKKVKNMIHGKKEVCMGSGDFEDEGFAARKKRLKDQARFGETDHKAFRAKVMGGGTKPLGRGEEPHPKSDSGYQKRREEMSMEGYRRDNSNVHANPNRLKDVRVDVGDREVVRGRAENECGVATSGGGVFMQQRGWRDGGGGGGLLASEDLQMPARSDRVNVGGVESLTARVKGGGGAFVGLFPVKADNSTAGRAGDEDLRASAGSGGYDGSSRRTPAGNIGDAEKAERRGGGGLKFGNTSDARTDDGRGGGESTYNYNRVLKGKKVEELDDEETESDDDRDFSDPQGAMITKGGVMSGGGRLIDVGVVGESGKVGKVPPGEGLNDGGRDCVSNKKLRLDGGSTMLQKVAVGPRNSPNNNIGNNKGAEKGSSGDDLVLSPVRRGGAPRGTMLERAIRDLEKGVAEMCPPDADQAQEQGTVSTTTQQQQQQQHCKKRLPPGVKEKLAKVARLAAKGQGKISSEVIDKLMTILGHRLQLPSLKRNLKEMVALGLSRQQAKEGQLQMSKEDLKQTVALRVAQLQEGDEPVPSSQAEFERDGTATVGGGENEPQRAFQWDTATEEKLWQFVDLYLRDMDEHKGSRLRKLYKELSAMWPAGWMDNKGIKEAIQRVNLRHQQERHSSGSGKGHKKGDESRSGQSKRRKAFQPGGGSEWMDGEGDAGTSRETVGFREATSGADIFGRSFQLDEAEGASGSGSGGGGWQREVRGDVPVGPAMLQPGNTVLMTKGAWEGGVSFGEMEKPVIKKKKISLLPVRKKRKVIMVESANVDLGIDRVPYGSASAIVSTGNSPPATGLHPSYPIEISRSIGNNPVSRPSSTVRVSQSPAFIHGSAAAMGGLGREGGLASGSFPVQPGTPPQSQSTGLHEDGRDVTGAPGTGNGMKRSTTSPTKQLSPTPIPASA